MPPRTYLIWTILVILASIHRTFACPQSIVSICKCSASANGLRIECVDRSLDEVLRSFDQDIKIDKLAIRNTNSITIEIPAHAFGHIAIRELEITGNNIIRIDDNAFGNAASQLVSLILADNALTSFPKLDAMTNLEVLDLRGNAIATIPDNAFANTKKIHRLQLQSNRICKLGPNALNETKERLEFLDLSNNCLDEVPAQNLRGAQKLQSVDISGNKIKNVPSLRFMNLPSLIELRLNSNSMELLHPLAFMNVPNLEQLNLSNNKLATVDTNRFQSFTKLATLDLSGNRLSQIASNSFQNIAKLRHLILDDNQIELVETLAFSSLPALQMISLQNNGLQRLYRNAFDSLPSLTSLLLANNSLDEIGEGTLAGIPALQQLILSGNRLTTLSSGSFDSITQLTTLDLSNNLLTSIETNVFQNLNKLFWLDLSGNRLSGLPKDVFYTKISNVLLQGNPLTCNESIDWLVQYLVSNNVRTFLPNQHDVKCADPPERRGTLLKDIMLQRANQTFFNNLHSSAGPNRLPINISTSELNPNLIANPNQPGLAPASGQPRTEDLLKSLPQLAALINGPGGLENMDLTKLPPDLIRYVAQGGQIPGVSKEMMQKLTQRYLVQMASKNEANSQSTLSAAIPNQISANANPNHASNPIAVPVPTPTYNNQPSIIFPIRSGSSVPPLPIDISAINASATLPPLNVIPPELIQRVLNGGTIPGFTQEQTEAIKQRYLQQAFTAGVEVTTLLSRPIQSHSNAPTLYSVFTESPPIMQYSASPYFNFSDLQSLNIDLSKIPPDVIRDLAAGRTPDFGRIPQDIIRVIMEKRPKLFGEIVSRELRTKSSNGTKSATDSSSLPVDLAKKRPTYDVNDLDKKADISVLGQEIDNQQMLIWTGVALGAIGAVTIIAVAVLCWRRRVARLQRRASRQHEDTSDTSKFFEQQGNFAAPEPPPRRSKLKFEDNSAPSQNALDLFFGGEPTTRGPTSPFALDQTNRSSGPIFSLDSTNRLNNQLYNFDPINRVVPGQQYRSVNNMPNYPAQTHFSSPPPLPNHPPAHTAVFDHNTGAWMFIPANGNYN